MAWLLSVLCIVVTVQIPSMPVKATVSNGQIVDITADDAINWVKSNLGNSLGNKVEGAYQCVGLTAQYLKYLGTWFGGSACEYANAQNVPSGITVIQGATPQKGDILIYLNTPSDSCHYAGHVAIYESNYSTYHQNYYGHGYVEHKEFKYDNSAYLNFTCQWCKTYVTQYYWGVWRPNFKTSGSTQPTNQNPVGDVNSISSSENKISIRGWTYDPDTPNESLQIHVYVGEPAGTPGKSADIIIDANKPSQDVTNAFGIGGNHRFEETFETSYTGNQNVYIYAINSENGHNPLIGQGTVNLTAPITASIKDYGIGGSRGSVSYTNAVLYATVSTNARSGIDEVGVRVGTTANNWNIGTIENQSLSSAGYAQLENNGYFEMWFNCNEELNTHPVLSPGTTYYYQFFVKINGKETTSAVNTFRTDEIPMTGISLNKSSLHLTEGDTETLSVSYIPENTTYSKQTEWSSSDHSVATVKNGVITAIGEGNAMITACCGRYTAICKVNVASASKPLTKITLNTNSLQLLKGESETLSVSYTPANTTDSKTITWSSSDPSIATVENGVVTAIGKGSATITARCGKITDTCIVTVKEPISPNATPTPSIEPTPTSTPAPSADPTPSNTPAPTSTPSNEPAPTSTPSNTPAPTSTPSNEPAPTSTPSNTPAPTSTPSNTPAPTSTPSNTPAPTSAPTPKTEQYKSTPQHTHDFKWVTIQVADTTQDGLEELRCDCGMVSTRNIIPSSQVSINELYQNLDTAPANGSIVFDSNKMYTISDYLIQKLQDRTDVTTTITFEYEHKKYRMTIPANVDYTELLEDQNYFYGYFYFAEKIEAKIEEVDDEN